MLDAHVKKLQTAKQSTVTKQGADAQAEIQRLEAQLAAKERDLSKSSCFDIW